MLGCSAAAVANTVPENVAAAAAAAAAATPNRLPVPRRTFSAVDGFLLIRSGRRFC